MSDVSKVCSPTPLRQTGSFSAYGRRGRISTTNTPSESAKRARGKSFPTPSASNEKFEAETRRLDQDVFVINSEYFGNFIMGSTLEEIETAIEFIKDEETVKQPERNSVVYVFLAEAVKNGVFKAGCSALFLRTLIEHAVNPSPRLKQLGKAVLKCCGRGIKGALRRPAEGSKVSSDENVRLLIERFGTFILAYFLCRYNQHPPQEDCPYREARSQHYFESWPRLIPQLSAEDVYKLFDLQQASNAALEALRFSVLDSEKLHDLLRKEGGHLQEKVFSFLSSYQGYWLYAHHEQLYNLPYGQLYNFLTRYALSGVKVGDGEMIKRMICKSMAKSLVGSNKLTMFEVCLNESFLEKLASCLFLEGRGGIMWLLAQGKQQPVPIQTKVKNLKEELVRWLLPPCDFILKVFQDEAFVKDREDIKDTSEDSAIIQGFQSLAWKAMGYLIGRTGHASTPPNPFKEVERLLQENKETELLFRAFRGELKDTDKGKFENFHSLNPKQVFLSLLGLIHYAKYKEWEENCLHLERITRFLAPLMGTIDPSLQLLNDILLARSAIFKFAVIPCIIRQLDKARAEGWWSKKESALVSNTLSFLVSYPDYSTHLHARELAKRFLNLEIPSENSAVDYAAGGTVNSILSKAEEGFVALCKEVALGCSESFPRRNIKYPTSLANYLLSCFSQSNKGSAGSRKRKRRPF